MNIVVVDYEVGNYGSVLAAFKTLGYHPVLTRDKDTIAELTFWFAWTGSVSFCN